MATDEVRTRLRERLEEEFGVDEATILMDRPPGGWGDLVTNESIDRRLDAFERRLDERIDLKLTVLRSEIRAVRTELGSEIAAVRTELGSEIGSKIGTLDGKIGSLHAEIGSKIGTLDGKIGSLHAEIGSLRFELLGTIEHEIRAQTWRLITAMASLVAAVGMFVGLGKL